MKTKHDVVIGSQEAEAAIRGLIEQFKSGELSSVALRVYRAGGAWEDIVIGGTEEERAQALAELERMLRGAH